MERSEIMDRIVKTISKFAWVIATVALFLSALFTLITTLATFPDSFMPIVGTVLRLVIVVALTVAIPVLLLINKPELAKKATIALGVYWVITWIIGFLGDSAIISAAFDGLTITIGIFEFIIALGLIAFAAMICLNEFTGNASFKKLSVYILLIVLCVFVITAILAFVANIVAGSPWTDYLSNINSYLFMPIGFGLMLVPYLDEE